MVRVVVAVLAASLVGGCALFSRVAVGPAWYVGEGAKGLGVVVTVGGTAGKGEEHCGDNYASERAAYGLGLFGGLESGVRIAAPQAQPIGVFAGLEAARASTGRRFAFGLGFRVSASLAAPPVAFLGKAVLHLDLVWAQKDPNYIGISLEGGFQFGEGPHGLPFGGYVALAFVYRGLGFGTCS